jgi:hypothetical protein
MPEPAAASYENSSGFIRAFTEALKELGLWERLQRELPADVLRPFESPSAQLWWPGSLLGRCVDVVERISGTEAVEKAAYLSVKKGVLPIAMPLVKVSFALFGPSPNSIFARASSFGATSMRGCQLEWTKQSDTSGLFTATYASAVPKSYAALWRGTISFVWELTKVDGSFGPIAHELDGKKLSLPLSWKSR